MKNKVDNSKSGRLYRTILVIICIVLLACAFLAFFQYQIASKRISRDSAKNQLQEVAEFNATAVWNEMESSMNTLKTLAKSLKYTQNELSSEEKTKLLQNIVSNSPFSKLWLTDMKGNATSNEGDVFSNLKLENFYEGVVVGQSGVTRTTLSRLTGEPILCIYSPIVKDEKTIGALYGIYEVKRLSAFTELKSFSGSAESLIVEGNGNVVLSSGGERDSNEIISIWDVIDELTLKGMNKGHVEEIVSGKASAFIEFEVENHEGAIAYIMPIGFEDWYLVEIVPNQVIVEKSASFSGIAACLLGELLIIFAIAIATIVFYGQKYRRTLRENNAELLVSNEWLEIALANSTSGIFEYDEKTGIISECMNCCQRMKEFFTPSDFAEQYKLSGEERDSFLKLFEDVERSEENISALISFEENGKRKYSKVTLKKIFDQTGRAIRIIGTKEDITAFKEIQTRFDKELEYRDTILSDVKGIFDVNLDTGDVKVEKFDSQNFERVKSKTRYNELQKYVVENAVYFEDRRKAAGATNVSALKKAYDEKLFEVKVEIRFVVENEIKWFQWIAHLFLDPSTKELKCNVYVKDIDEQKKKELALYHLSSHDALTDLYNRKRAEENINAILKSRKKNDYGVNALFVVDVDNFKMVNDTFGHSVGDKLLKKIADEFRRNFRMSDVYARIGGDEFIALLRSADSFDTVKRKAMELKSAVENIVIEGAEELKSSCSIGVAIATFNEQDFDSLFLKADKSLYKAKALGKNEVYFQK